MEMLVKCDRCGALVGPCDAKETPGGTRLRFWAAVTTCTVETDGGMALDLGGATVLCPDCMGQLKEWLDGGPEEPQVREEAGQSSDGDSAERLAFDMARALACTPEDCCGIRIACEYFGHGYNTGCRDRESSRYGEECTASGYLSDCWETMCASIRRRCEALGIDLGGEADAE